MCDAAAFLLRARSAVLEGREAIPDPQRIPCLAGPLSHRIAGELHACLFCRAVVTCCCTQTRCPSPPTGPCSADC